ncbi:MAG: ADP-ribosylglycohydrolase family protein [Chloroflexota bacterium]|nr:ADP-ribosylglycohydrolase family protein [Chloroflexota bacterium]
MSRQHAEAILFGLAIGDALGYPVEFLDLPAIKSTYGPRGITELPEPALFSDDTQMALALAEGILDAGLDANLDAIMEAVGERFISWSHRQSDPSYSRAPGNTCMAGIANYEKTRNWRTSGLVQSKGCGSVMRVAPVGYLYQFDLERMIAVAEASGIITHAHPAAIAATNVGAYAIKLALEGTPPDGIIAQVQHLPPAQNDEFLRVLHRIGHALGWTNTADALYHIGTGWTGDEAITMALYCAAQRPESYADTIRLGANLKTGDSDSVACIAGGIQAARLGLDAIPSEWRARIEDADYLRDLAARMADERRRVYEN